MGSEMGPLSSPGTTSYYAPHGNYRSISHHFRSAPDVPDRPTDDTGLAMGGTVH